MSYVLPILFALGVYVALPAVLVAGWVRWARRSQIGRTWPSLTGFSLGTASAVLAIGSMVYAEMIDPIRRTLDPIPNAPRGRKAASATLQRPFYPEIPQLPSYLLAYFYSATLAWFYSALDTSKKL